MKYIKNSWDWIKHIMYPYRYVIFVVDILLVIALIILLVREVLGR